MPLNQSFEVNQSKKSKLLLRVVYISITVLAIGLIICFNFNRLYAVYTYTFKTEKFDQGSKVYVSNSLVGPKIQGSAIAALRLIRPMTEEEVKDIILISPDQRVRFLQIARNPNSKPYVTHFNSYFDLKEIYKTKNTIIGEYKATVLKDVKFLDNMKTFYAVFLCD